MTSHYHSPVNGSSGPLGQEAREISRDECERSYEGESSDEAQEESGLPQHVADRLSLFIRDRLAIAAAAEVCVLYLAPLLYFWPGFGVTLVVAAWLVCTLVLRLWLWRQALLGSYTLALVLASFCLAVAAAFGAAQTMQGCYLCNEDLKTVLECDGTSHFRIKVMRPLMRWLGMETPEHGIAFPTIYEIPCQLLMISVSYHVLSRWHKLPLCVRKLPNGTALFLDLLDCIQILLAVFHHTAYLLFEKKLSSPALYLALFVFAWTSSICQVGAEFYLVGQASIEQYQKEEMESVHHDRSRTISIALFDGHLHDSSVVLRSRLSCLWTCNALRSISINALFFSVRMYMRKEAGYSVPLYTIKNIVFITIAVYTVCRYSADNSPDFLQSCALDFLPGGSQMTSSAMEEVLDDLQKFGEHVRKDTDKMGGIMSDDYKAFLLGLRSHIRRAVRENHHDELKKTILHGLAQELNCAAESESEEELLR